MTRSEAARALNKIARKINEHKNIGLATVYIGEGGLLSLGIYFTGYLSTGDLTKIVTEAGGELLQEYLRKDPLLKAKRVAPRVSGG